MPAWLKNVGWLSTAALLAALISALVFGTDVNGIDWALVGIATIAMIVFLPVALWGWLPFRFRAGFIERPRVHDPDAAADAR